MPLFALLDGMGCDWVSRPGRDSAVELLIWRRSDRDAAAAARAAG